MFIFTRRAIQKMLDEISVWMPSGAMAELVSRLNTPRTNRLPQMWEVAWLYALGGIVAVEHERTLPSGKPDLWFSVKNGSVDVQVVADVTTLSDTALHESNPFEKLSNALYEQAQKAGFKGGSFNIKAEHVELKSRYGRKVRLLIPTGPNFDRIVKRYLKPFVETVVKEPSSPHRLDVDEDIAKFSVEYLGLNKFSYGSYRSYEVTLSRENNILHNRLKEKTKQLRGAPRDAVRMLIVCDGDCSLLRRGGIAPLEGFSAQKICEKFLDKSTTIDLILMVSVDDGNGGIFRRHQLKSLECRMVAALSGRPSHLTNDVVNSIVRTFDEAVKRLPLPELMPNNALRRNIDSEWSANMGGAYVVSNGRVKISARALLELLAGIITYENFAEMHHFGTSDRNIFDSYLSAGQLIRATKIESLGCEKDDDWIEFEFGYPDPAVSKFKENSGRSIE